WGRKQAERRRCPILIPISQRTREHSNCGKSAKLEGAYQLIHKIQVAAQHVCPVEQHQGDGLVGRAMVCPLPGRRNEQVWMIEAVRGHLRRRLKLRWDSEQFVRDTADALQDIPYASGHEVSGHSCRELVRDVGS